MPANSTIVSGLIEPQFRPTLAPVHPEIHPERPFFMRFSRNWVKFVVETGNVEKLATQDKWYERK
jgi:hypothetical protein